MANINLYEIYNNKVRRYSATDSANFRNAFVESVNMAFAEFNSEVFLSDTLDYLDSFQDIISARLNGFTSLTFDASSNTLMGGREFWAVEYQLERLNDTNGFTDTITDDNSDVVIVIANNVLSLTAEDVTFSATLPDIDSIKILISSNKEGIKVFYKDMTGDFASESTDLGSAPDIEWSPDGELELTFTDGDEETSQPIGTISAHVISAVSGYNLVTTAFYSAVTKILDFQINEGTGSTITDSINGYELTAVDGAWIVAYVEDSCTLDRKYLPYFDLALQYHMQESGEWAMEPDDARYTKWYGRGIKLAKNTYHNNTTYTNPLGI